MANQHLKDVLVTNSLLMQDQEFYDIVIVLQVAF